LAGFFLKYWIRAAAQFNVAVKPLRHAQFPNRRGSVQAGPGRHRSNFLTRRQTSIPAHIVGGPRFGPMGTRIIQKFVVKRVHFQRLYAVEICRRFEDRGLHDEIISSGQLPARWPRRKTVGLLRNRTHGRSLRPLFQFLHPSRATILPLIGSSNKVLDGAGWDVFLWP